MKINRTAWLNKKPLESSDAVRHYISSSHQLHDWDIVSASVRGKRHAHCGEWRDDSCIVSISGKWAILTVADGAGSAPLSRIGSRTAARTVNTFIKRAISKLSTKSLSEVDISPDIKEDIFSILKNSFVKAIKSVCKESEKRQCHASKLSTTLLTVIYTRHNGKDLFYWINVGDCVFAVFTEPNVCDVLCDEDHGISGGETRFITSEDIIESLDLRIHHVSYAKPVHSFVIMTDGVADDLYPLVERLNDLIEGEVVGKGYMYLNENEALTGIKHFLKNEKYRSKKLIEWLKYDKLGSPYDDRTLIVALKNV